jgi:uncharacterized membrane protein
MPIEPNHYNRQLIDTRRPLVFWLIGAATALSILLVIFAAPVAAADDHNDLATAIYRSFSAFCHQIPERSYFVAGHPLAVCARCTGLYAGFALTFLLYPLIRSLKSTETPPRKWLILAAIPMAVDFSLTIFGIWENTHTSRLFTGLLLGSTTVFYVIPGITDLSLLSWRTLRPNSQAPTFTMVSSETIAAAPSDYSAPNRRL